MPPIVDKEKCERCAVCIEICPEDVFFGSQDNEEPEVTYPEECSHCAGCVVDCPTQAISLYFPLPMRL